MIAGYSIGELLSQDIEFSLKGLSHKGTICLNRHLFAKGCVEITVRNLPVPEQGGYVSAFYFVNHIVADPNLVRPSHPVGTWFSQYTNPPTSWSDIELIEELSSYSTKFQAMQWEFVKKSYGGYSEYVDKPHRYHLMDLDIGGKLIGIKENVKVPILSCGRQSYLQYRLWLLCVVEPRDKGLGYSALKVGDTRYEFDGFIFE